MTMNTYKSIYMLVLKPPFDVLAGVILSTSGRRYEFAKIRFYEIIIYNVMLLVIFRCPVKQRYYCVATHALINPLTDRNRNWRIVSEHYIYIYIYIGGIGPRSSGLHDCTLWPSLSPSLFARMDGCENGMSHLSMHIARTIAYRHQHWYLSLNRKIAFWQLNIHIYKQIISRLGWNSIVKYHFMIYTSAYETPVSSARCPSGLGGN